MSPEVTTPAHGDEALARAAAAGEERAVRTVLSRVSGKLRSIAWHMTHDFHESQDLCQEALLKASSPRALRGYRGEGPLDAYLVRVGVRAMLSARRTKPARDWRQVVIPEELPERRFEPGNAALVGGLDPALRRALDELPVRARLIVLLITVGEYSYEEAAQAIGLPVGTVKSAYSRARTALRTSLAGYSADDRSPAT